MTRWLDSARPAPTPPDDQGRTEVTRQWLDTAMRPDLHPAPVQDEGKARSPSHPRGRVPAGKQGLKKDGRSWRTWFSVGLRPHSISHGPPGNATTIAHPGPPSAYQHSHHKLPTLDPQAVQAELLSATDGLDAASQELVDKATGSDVDTPPARPQAAAAKVTCGGLRRRLFAAAGIGHGRPKKGHALLLRYAGTAMPETGASAAVSDAAPSAPTSLVDLNQTLVHLLEHTDQHLLASIDAQHHSELEAALERNLHHTEQDLGLRGRRAVNLSDRAAELRHQHDETERQLRLRRDQLSRARSTLHDLQRQLSQTREALADAEQALEAQREQFRAVLQSGLEEVERQINRQHGDISQLESASSAARTAANDAKLALFRKWGGSSRAKLKQEVEQSRQAATDLQTRLDDARAALSSLQQRRERLQQADCGASDNLLGARFVAERALEVDELSRTRERLERSCVVEGKMVSIFQSQVTRLESELHSLDEQRRQVEHSAAINAAELWKMEDSFASMQELPPKLMPGQGRKAQALKTAESARQNARAALDQQGQALQQHLLETLPGFDPETHCDDGADAMSTWASRLTERVHVFGADALSPAAALAVGMNALSAATQKNATLVAGTLDELGAASLSTLIPPPDAELPAETDTPARPLGESASATAKLLAAVPRGMQVLTHLLAPDAPPLPTEQLEAAQIFLRAGDVLDRTEASDTTSRDWLIAAQTAARHAVHASSVKERFAAATADQRAAFHAVRNGYESKAPGSPYAKANQHLQMLVQWLQEISSGRRAGMLAEPNPLHALKEGLQVASSEALPTPRRRASEELSKAAGHLAAYLSMRRHAQLQRGHCPSPADLMMEALAEHVLRTSIDADLTRMKLDARAIGAIEQRQLELLQHIEGQAVTHGRPLAPAPANPAFEQAWQKMRSGRFTVPEAMSLLQRHLIEQPPTRVEQPGGDLKHAFQLESTHRARLHGAIGKANRLLHDGDPGKVRSAQAFFDFMRDMLEQLEWRDKLRIGEQKVVGANLTPLSAAAALGSIGVGGRLILGAQHNQDRLMEIYMGRTGLGLQVGRQSTCQLQVGAGINTGYLLVDADDVAVGLGLTADIRRKWESSIEDGLQIRVPRRGKGEELQLRAQFLDMFEHLMHLAGDDQAGPLEQRDLLHELLAHHPSLTVGLIDNATRRTTSTESNLAATAGVRVGDVDGKPRRASIGGSLGLKSKRDSSHTSTTIAGYMTTVSKDSSAQTRVEISARASAGVLLNKFGKGKASADSAEAAAGQSSSAADGSVATLSSGALDIGYSQELYSNGVSYFSTLWLFGNEIDPVRTDRGFEFFSFKDFEKEVRRNWDFWVNYGIPKVKAQVDEKLHYTVAERQLEDFLDRARRHMGNNKFASLIVDWAMKAEAAPHLDALRAQSRLLSLAGRGDEASRADRAFDDLMGSPALWEPTILILREKGKLQKERGIDFLVKLQTNRLAESMRTVAQWPGYDPVPHPQPGEKVEPERTWKRAQDPGDETAKRS